MLQIAVVAGGRVHRVGTGSWVHRCGLVVTALHALRQAQGAAGCAEQDVSAVRVALAPAPSERAHGNFVHQSVQVAAVDTDRDLALLRTSPAPLQHGHVDIAGSPVPTPAQVLRLALERARDGEAIAVSGYPATEPVLVTTTGTVASAWGFDLTQLPDLAEPVLADLDDLYLVDATINPGNSGGPVYRTRDGALIGVCLSVRMAQAQLEQLDRTLLYPSGLGIVVPAKYVQALIEQVERPV